MSRTMFRLSMLPCTLPCPPLVLGYKMNRIARNGSLQLVAAKISRELPRLFLQVHLEKNRRPINVRIDDPSPGGVSAGCTRCFLHVRSERAALQRGSRKKYKTKRN